MFKYFKAGNTRDSYNDPDETYRLAKSRGMDFVTFTDHDTVAGCLKFQDRHPDYADFFVSAEIETFFPRTGHRIHVNVFDLSLPQWKVIDRKRRNIFDLVEYLRSESLLYSANHLFQSYRMRQAPEDFFTTMLELFDVFEVKNGSMAYQHNALVEDLLTAAKEKRGSLALLGGSDAHIHGDRRSQGSGGQRDRPADPGRQHAAQPSDARRAGHEGFRHAERQRRGGLRVRRAGENAS